MNVLRVKVLMCCGLQVSVGVSQCIAGCRYLLVCHSELQAAGICWCVTVNCRLQVSVGVSQ
jgi:hypothetical protein